MNWNHFLLLLAGVYFGYYALNLIADLYLKKKPPGQESEDVLFFSEDTRPEIVLYDDQPEQPIPETLLPPVPAYPSPPLESTGAVSLKELIRIAQAGLIQYTAAIPY